MTLAYTREGAGPPLLLLHALGSSRRAWDPVIARLAARFTVLAVDLPGFGASPPLTVEPTPSALAAAVGELVDSFDEPVHVVGNSLGGWVALELAARRELASLTLLAPAGLWRSTTPWYCRVSLRVTHWLAVHAASAVERPLLRVLVFGQTHGAPRRITPAYARTAIDALRGGTGFAATVDATARRHYAAPPTPLTAPITVAFGTRERLLPGRARRRDQLPAHTRYRTLRGCGHIPMADDPAAVTALIVTSTAVRALHRCSDA